MSTGRDVEARRVILLGSTGSIGTQAIAVIEHLNREHAAGRYPIRHDVVGLAAGANVELLCRQAQAMGVRELALANGALDEPAPPNCDVRTGHDAAERLVRDVEADLIIGAIMGVAGLPATLAAIELGRDVALANKETLVAAGELVVPAARRRGVRLFPIDSEHSAMWQSLPDAVCPPCDVSESVARIVVTASGGPFRTWSHDRTYHATPEQALAHPTWNMGAKITIDCASMTNKALEVIETHWLFGLPGDRIDVIVHPQSIIHSFVEYVDGSVIAQLGAPDMCTPIQWALTWPHRTDGVSKKLDFAALSRLDFEAPDLERFPAIRLAYEVIDHGGAAGAVFNGANEAAVAAFIEGRIPFGRIAELSAAALASIIGNRKQPALRDLEEVVAADREARRFVNQTIASAGAPHVATRRAAPATGIGSIDA